MVVCPLIIFDHVAKDFYLASSAHAVSGTFEYTFRGLENCLGLGDAFLDLLNQSRDGVSRFIDKRIPALAGTQVFLVYELSVGVRVSFAEQARCTGGVVPKDLCRYPHSRISCQCILKQLLPVGMHSGKVVSRADRVSVSQSHCAAQDLPAAKRVHLVCELG